MPKQAEKSRAQRPNTETSAQVSPGAFVRDDRRQIELRHLRYFVTVAEEGNISRAAARLSVSQPPLSNQIRQLETFLQAALFQRNARGVELTAAGAEFLEHARMILARLDQAVDAARFVERGTGGKLQLGCIFSVFRLFSANILSSAAAQFPALGIQFQVMSEEEQIEALLRESIDLGIVSGSAGKEGVRSKVLLEAPYVAAIPAGHRLARRKSVSLEDIAEDMGVPRGIPPSLSFRQQATSIFKRRGIVARSLHAVADIALLMEIVEAGMGVGVVPSCIDKAKHPRAIFVPISDSLKSYVIRIFWRVDSLTPLRAAFIDHMAQLTWSQAQLDAARDRINRRKDLTTT